MKIKENTDGSIDIPLETWVNCVTGKKKDHSEYEVKDAYLEVDVNDDGTSDIKITYKNRRFMDKIILIEDILLDEQYLVYNEKGPQYWTLMDTDGKNLTSNKKNWY